jgi:hypothetical protein
MTTMDLLYEHGSGQEQRLADIHRTGTQLTGASSR